MGLLVAALILRRVKGKNGGLCKGWPVAENVLMGLPSAACSRRHAPIATALGQAETAAAPFRQRHSTAVTFFPAEDQPRYSLLMVRVALPARPRSSAMPAGASLRLRW